MTRFTLSPETRRQVFDAPFLLESGETLPRLELAWRSWGRLNAAADNAIIICHALTGSADADDWWGDFFGAGQLFNPATDFILCSNALGSCYGSSGPTSQQPNGQHWGADFPRITLRDQVQAQMLLADALGIRRIQLVIGGSMGGLQALEWALLDPQRVQAVASIAASGRHSAWCLAQNEAQRLALQADPGFKQGRYDLEQPPRQGLAAARAIAMLSYRSPESLNQRCSRQSAGERFGHKASHPDDFAARAWLRHHGDHFVQRFDANSYLSLLDAMDSHDLERGRGSYEAALASIHQPVLIGSIPNDGLYVPAEQQELARLLPQARLLTIESLHGHDGFLIDANKFHVKLLAFKNRLGAGNHPG